MQLSHAEYTSFYQRIQVELPDNRDNRGKYHELAFVVATFIMGIIIGRTKVSSIQRYMSDNYDNLCRIFDYEQEKAVSRAQLPRILEVVDWEIVNKISQSILQHNIVFNDQIKEWVAIDGKEQRGTIRTKANGEKEKRGLANVRAITHQTRFQLGQTYYEGDKESEIPAVRQLLLTPNLKGRSVTLDALHCNPKTTQLIASQKGRYIIEVKENQAEMLAECRHVNQQVKPVCSIEDPLEKGHGRYAQRTYTFFDISKEYIDKRWKKSNIKTLIVVDRRFVNIRSGKVMQEKSFYISNQKLCQLPQLICKELAKAIREHWQVENDNQVRDVTFKEDQLKGKNRDLSRVIAVLLIAINIFKTTLTKNYQKQIEWFNHHPDQFHQYLREIDFL